MIRTNRKYRQFPRKSKVFHFHPSSSGHTTHYRYQDITANRFLYFRFQPCPHYTVVGAFCQLFKFYAAMSNIGIIGRSLTLVFFPIEVVVKKIPDVGDRAIFLVGLCYLVVPHLVGQSHSFFVKVKRGRLTIASLPRA